MNSEGSLPFRQRLRLHSLNTLGRGVGLLPSLPGRRGRRIRRVLLIRPDHLGDLLFLSPALERWRHAVPHTVETTLSVGPWGADLATHLPRLSAIDSLPYPGFTRRPKKSALDPYGVLMRQAWRLRRQRYDLAIILRFDHWWGGLLAQWAGIPRRLGYATDPLASFLTDALPYAGQAHEVERNLALVEYALQHYDLSMDDGDEPEFVSLSYAVRPEERGAVTDLLERLPLQPCAPHIVIHPGAGAAVKLWPAERWAAVADGLIARCGAEILLIGGPDELGLAWQVAAQMRGTPHILAGRTSLGELGALLERADLVLGADSGPLHLAVAAGAPTLHLYGPVDPAVFGPWTAHPERHRVLMAEGACVPCNRLDFAQSELPEHRCMETLSVPAVLEAAQAVLSAGQLADVEEDVDAQVNCLAYPADV